MTPMIFLGLVFVIFLITYITTTERKAELLNQPSSLIHWLTTGNWPAKVGAGLMIIGFGALLRYLMLNIILAPHIKLTAGIACSLVLGLLSVWVKNQPNRKEVHLSLGGAALGVAYLTAYSAHAYFGYFDQIQSLCLFFLVAGAASAFAIVSNAMSIAILSIFGAYLAPTLVYTTHTSAEASVIYSYYLIVSLLCLFMIYIRGWRSLIHLSFLFTLAGGLFFAWTRSFYLPQYHNVMEPLLLGLITIHLAMPILENQANETKWVSFFDRGYFFLLPIVSLIVILSISPNAYEKGWQDALILCGLWGLASLVQYKVYHKESLHYASIAFIFFTIAVLILLPIKSWCFIWLVISLIVYLLAPPLKTNRLSKRINVLFILFFFACYVISMPVNEMAYPFFNRIFFQNLVIAFLLLALSENQPSKEPLYHVFKAMTCIWVIYLLYFEAIMNLWAMRFPALISLSWVIIGTSLCLVASRINSRLMWSSGAFLLIIAALKLIFFDFSSLDQVGNIIAMILSGAMFMGLAWLAPIPPKTKTLAPLKHASPEDSQSFDNIPHQPKIWLWIAVIAVILFTMNYCSVYQILYEENTITHSIGPLIPFSSPDVEHPEMNSVQSPTTEKVDLDALEGHWLHDTYPTTIHIKGQGTLLFCNEQDDCAKGFYRGKNIINVPGWQVTGTINADKNNISWSNGTTWVRH